VDDGRPLDRYPDNEPGNVRANSIACTDRARPWLVQTETASVIPLAAIRVADRRRRRIDPAAVERLAESMRANGLLNPITVRGDAERGYDLIAGAHRLAAGRLLRLVDIPAIVRDVDDLQAAIIEIDENLIRAELTALERAEHLADRQRLYEQRYPSTKHGGAPGLPGGGKAKGLTMRSFAADATVETGLGKSTIQRDVQIGTVLVKEVRDELRDTKTAKSITALVALAALPAPDQRAVVATASLDDPAAVRRTAQAVKAKRRPKQRGRPAPRPRAAVPPRPEGAARFAYTLGALHRFVELAPSEVAPLLTAEETAAFRSVVGKVRRQFDLFTACLDQTARSEESGQDTRVQTMRNHCQYWLRLVTTYTPNELAESINADEISDAMDEVDRVIAWFEQVKLAGLAACRPTSTGVDE
jgi:ParB family chromosome partitioning protein